MHFVVGQWADLRANCMKYGDVAREGETDLSTIFQLHAEVLLVWSIMLLVM